MILDLLISRYLDSELSEEEDRELRSITSSNLEARETFDHAVHLHIAMRCEDPLVEVPADLVHETRSLILDKIDAVAVTKVVTPPVSSSRTMRSVVAMVALLLILVLPIDELQREYGIKNAGSTPGIAGLEHSDVHPPREFRIKSTGSNHRIAESQNEIAQETLAPGSFHSQAVLDVAQALSQRETQSVARPSVARPSVAQSVARPSVAQSAPSVAQRDRSAEPSEDVPLLLTTFYTSSMQGSLDAVSAITQFSQSIGYGLNEESYVGLEVGAMQYTVDRMMQTTVRTDGGSSAMGREAAIRPASAAGGGKLTPTSTPTGTFREESTRIVDQQSVAWGAAFYQRPILSTGAVAMLGRVGVGAAMDGMLAYGRLQAEVHLFPMLSLTMGAEARYAPMRTGAASGQQSGQTYGGFLSMVYGIQLSL